MKLALISDIHGNLEAFEAVLADLDRQRPDEVLCLGDSVGYGPNPQEVLDELRRRRIPNVMGNHELGLSDPSKLAWFNPSARQVLEQTAELLDAEALAYIAGLPRYLARSGCRVVHGLPPDSATTYLFEVSVGKLKKVMNELPEDISFVGHTHVLELVSLAGEEFSRRELGRERLTLAGRGRHLVNIGSVGQPRDGDLSAKYALFDTVSRELEIRYVPYDSGPTKRKIRERGFAEIYARRL